MVRVEFICELLVDCSLTECAPLSQGRGYDNSARMFTAKKQKEAGKRSVAPFRMTNIKALYYDSLASTSLSPFAFANLVDICLGTGASCRILEKVYPV